MTWLYDLLVDAINWMKATTFPFLNANIFDVFLGLFIIGTIIYFFIPESEDD